MRIPTPEELPGLTRKERTHIAQLSRRAAFLETRIEEADEDLSWDKSELSALTWAIETLSDMEPLED